MDDHEKQAYENQAQKLRIELKTWEVEWAASHNGKKPGHSDIKQNPDIAQKYKQYNKLRDILSGKIPPPPKDDEPEPRKRKPNEAPPVSYTPSKRPRTAETPTTSRFLTEGVLNASVTPSLSRKLFGPKLPTSVSPTPQRDGRVLGLFDILARTPSKSTSGGLLATAAPVAANLMAQHLLASPSRQQTSTTLLPTDPSSVLGKSPVRTTASASKRSGRQQQDHSTALATTPMRKRDGKAGSRTPSSSSSARHLSPLAKLRHTTATTPAFLRRAALSTLDENDEWQIAPLRLPRKPLGRSLSGMVASLRRLEEDAADEDLDVLREMEMEAVSKNDGGGGPSDMSEPLPKPSRLDTSFTQEKLMASKAKDGDGDLPAEVLDSQTQPRPVLLGGFDDEGLYDNPKEAQPGDRDGRLQRVYKKKGQKRTTRLVNMRPTRTKRPVQQKPEDTADDDEEQDEVVLETQLGASGKSGLDNGKGEPDPAFRSDFEDSDAGDDDTYGSVTKKRSKKKKEIAVKDGEKGTDGVVKKTVRKIKATAHQNFKRLKLRNRGAKGGPGYNSKFRRKR